MKNNLAIKDTIDSRAFPAVILLLGFTAAVILRVVLGGPGVAQSPQAGLAFALSLIAIGFAARTKFLVSWRSVGIGMLGGMALCVPSVIVRFSSQAHYTPAGNYLQWAIVVTAVAASEEFFLRGALFEATDRWLGEVGAVIVAAVAFAALHVPIYGWHVVPLDLAVGIWLGALRVVARTPAAPAVAHALADLLAWWLV